jgi:DNA processing protein
VSAGTPPPGAARYSPAQLAGATLANLRGMTPGRLRRLCERCHGTEGALEALRSGRAFGLLVGDTPPSRRPELASLVAAWRARASEATTARLLEARGVHVWLEGGHDDPIGAGIPDRPAVLLGEGARPDVLGRPRVAVVGTRQATPHGAADARELGAYLAGEGVTVVSGLAIGIDGAAHEGALEAVGGVVGVVATGLDIVYPRRHAHLDACVRDHGVVVSETAYGIGPLRGRFPVRNRIIAALADVVVVVEATATGGARITAQHALDYGRPVLAVPGSRRNPAAAGTNALIADGAHPLLEWSDVVLALGMTPGDRRQRAAPAPPTGADARVLAALGGEPATPDELATRCALGITEIASALTRLARAGWISIERGCAWPR